MELLPCDEDQIEEGKNKLATVVQIDFSIIYLLKVFWPRKRYKCYQTSSKVLMDLHIELMHLTSEITSLQPVTTTIKGDSFE